MSSLSSIYIKKETLKSLLEVLEKKGEKGIEITISTSDQTNDYGQNVSGYVSQTKEQREAGKPKYYVGNGKVFWTDGNITKAENKQKSQQQNNAPQDDEDDSLPY